MTTYSPFELEPIFIDFKNESYNLGLDIQANQNDTLTLNFICRNNGIEEDMSKYKVELRVHNNNANVDYIQTQNENVTLGKDGLVKIVCQSLKGKLTAYSGQLNGVLRIFNTENKQKATRIITMRIIADPLETDRANICESTITKLEDLDWILNEAYNIEDEFKKDIKEAIKQKDALIKTTNEAKVINTTLAGNITTGTELNSNLVNSNKLAETNQKELDTKNTTANDHIKTLTEKVTTATTLHDNLTKDITDGNNLHEDLTKNITDGTKVNDDLNIIVPKSEKISTDLNSTNSTATITKEDLTQLNTDSTKTKEDLKAENILADAKIETMRTFDPTHVIEDVGDLKKEVTDARGTYSDLNTRIENIQARDGVIVYKSNEKPMHDGIWFDTSDDLEQVEGNAVIKEIKNYINTTVKVDVDKNTTDIGTLKENVENNSSQLKEIEQNYYSLNNAISIPSNSDLNSYTKPGNYFSAGSGISNTLTNCPFTDGAFALKIERITIGSAINLKQILKANSSNVITYERNCLNGTWSEEWKQLATLSDTGWLDLALANGISSEVNWACKYRRVGKVVQLRGIIKGITTDTQSNTILATLPVGFRPATTAIFILPRSTNDSDYLKIYISSDGKIGSKKSNMVGIASTNGFMLTTIMYLVD
ncbi:hypothetical protein DVW05_10025 [Clostridium botulinum]|nr:hypothetical protein [Clostridium botulinum]